MKEISLTQNKVALIDDDDFDRVSQFRWRVSQVKNRFYAARYIKVKKGLYRTQLLHRFILSPKPNEQVDHINGNCLDCTKDNLRIATNIQNQHNRGKHIDNTSGYKGVDWMKSKRKWRARICCNSKNVHIGLFDNPIDAAKAYDEYAKKLHGRFARTNF